MTNIITLTALQQLSQTSAVFYQGWGIKCDLLPDEQRRVLEFQNGKDVLIKENQANTLRFNMPLK
jgi:hypothetical protein